MTPQNNVSHLNRDPRTYVGGNATPRPPFVPASGDKRKFVAKGHDAQLQDAQYGKFPVRLTLTDGMRCNGIVTKRDKYTITLRHTKGEDTGFDEIFYKHAIQGVLIDRSSQAGADSQDPARAE